MIDVAIANSDPSWQTTANIATVVGVAAAILGFGFALIQYRRDRLVRRVEHFARMHDILLSNQPLSKILHLVERDDAELAAISTTDKRAFVCFMEQVAVLLKAGLIRRELAYYMFGYPAIKCADSTHLWFGDFPKDEQNWAEFFAFVREMRKVHESKKARPLRLARNALLRMPAFQRARLSRAGASA
jgi:hypothetical protein